MNIDLNEDTRTEDERVVDAWLRDTGSIEPDDNELLDIAAIMAAHNDNPFG